MKIKDEMIEKAKKRGFLVNKNGNLFSCRILTENGSLTTYKLNNIAQIATTYGDGNVFFTTRLNIEISGIKYEDIENVENSLSKCGLSCGSTGNRLRSILACKGSACKESVFDTQKLAYEMHKKFYERFYNTQLTNKFEIGIAGCHNNCINLDSNDLLVTMEIKVNVQNGFCSNCKKCICIEHCKKDAIKRLNNRINIDENLCVNCGVCIKKCMFSAIEERDRGFRVYIGKGDYRVKLEELYNKGDMFRIIENIINVYKEYGDNNETISDVIKKIGFENFKLKLI